MKRFLCLLLALSALSAAAQRNTIAISDLPHLPSDTLPTDRPDVRIILYTDNTFRYLFTNADSLSRTEHYASHWDTTGIFAYRDISLQSLPPTIEIHVIDRYDGFHFPRTGQIVSRYGLRGRRNHNGIDIALRTGDPIHAAFDGRVRYSRYNMGGFGNLVIIRHTNGLESYYGHLSRRNVKAGDFVKAGQVIGYGGSTGRSRGPHLHFELRYADQAFDPERLIDFTSGQLRYQTFLLERSFFNIRSRAVEGLEEEDDSFDIEALMAANEIPEDGTLSEEIIRAIEEKELKAKEAEAAAKAAKYHTIRSGDTLLGLALKYGTTVDKICKLNGISRNTTLRIGRKLRIQ